MGRAKKIKQLRKVAGNYAPAQALELPKKWYYRIPVLGPWLYGRTKKKFNQAHKALQDRARRQAYQAVKGAL